MFRSILSLTVLTAAALASLASPDLAAQSAPGQASAGAITEVAPADALTLRTLVSDEALHRDRIARLERLRTLASQRGQQERLAEIDRLDRLERQRHEARRLATHSRLSPGAQREADSFVQRGGSLKMRRRANVAGQDGLDRGPVRASGERGLPQRKATTTRTGTRQSGSRPATRSGSRSSGGSRSGGGSRGPR